MIELVSASFTTRHSKHMPHSAFCLVYPRSEEKAVTNITSLGRTGLFAAGSLEENWDFQRPT